MKILSIPDTMWSPMDLQYFLGSQGFLHYTTFPMTYNAYDNASWAATKLKGMMGPLLNAVLSLQSLYHTDHPIRSPHAPQSVRPYRTMGNTSGSAARLIRPRNDR